MFTVKRILIEELFESKAFLIGLIVSLNLSLLSCNSLERKLEDSMWYFGPRKHKKEIVNKNKYFEIMTFGKQNKFEVGSYHSLSNTFHYGEIENDGDLIYSTTKWIVKQDTLFTPIGTYRIMDLNDKIIILKDIKTKEIKKWKKIVL
jgi:hypothetical protein